MTHVLVVDDDDDVREALAAVLTDEGYEVTEAAGGRSALAALALGPLPEVILLDWMMPVMDGVEVRRALLADPALAAIPVIFLTADGRLRERVYDLRASDVLTKPVRLDDLVDAIERARLRPRGTRAPGAGAPLM